MAGEAVTSDFLLSTATVMIGPQSKVMELSPALHSIGLVKNLQVTSTPTFVELTQGMNAQVVSSVATSTASTVTGEVYEYTARNLAYAAGVDASATGILTGLTPGFDPTALSYTLATAITVGGPTVVLGAGGGAGFVVGDFVVIQDLATPDHIHVGKVSVIATDTLTLATGYTMPTTAVFATATTVIYRVRAIKVGAQATQAVMGAKIVGILPNTAEPVTLIFPKVKIIKGLSLSFQNQNWANMPFEFMPYASLPSDAYYADLGASKTFMILRR